MKFEKQEKGTLSDEAVEVLVGTRAGRRNKFGKEFR